MTPDRNRRPTPGPPATLDLWNDERYGAWTIELDQPRQERILRLAAATHRLLAALTDEVASDTSDNPAACAAGVALSDWAAAACTTVSAVEQLVSAIHGDPDQPPFDGLLLI